MIMRSRSSMAGETAMAWLVALLVPVVFLLFLLFAAARTTLYSRWSRSMLERWAERDGYRIIEVDYRNVFGGPFFWTSSQGQTVCRVTVDAKGVVRTGWVRCGSWWRGLRSEQVEVRWDEAPAKTANPLHDRWVDG
jgi:hypothetical protein